MPSAIQPRFAMMVVIDQYDTQPGPYRVKDYRALADADLTGTDVAQRLLGSDLITYLGRHAMGWKLLRRIDERRGPSKGSYKIVSFVLDTTPARVTWACKT
jgi:hypothetical protein